MNIKVMGIDLSKSVFHVYAVDEHHKVVVNKTFRRPQLEEFIQRLEPCLIGLEACGGAHYWARKWSLCGHTVKLMPPQYVKPFVKTHKNDAADAEAICEALQRPTMRFVSVKTTDQQDLAALHRIRERLVCERTALGNQIRGFLCEQGISVNQGWAALKKMLQKLLAETPVQLSELFLSLLQDLTSELQNLEEKLKRHEARLKEIFSHREDCRRLGTIPGVGPITATAMVAHVGQAQGFRSGRQFAAYLGLVPRQHSSGGKTLLLGITKRGDNYLRRLLVHGARSLLCRVHQKNDARSRWIKEKIKTRGFNRTCVALANHQARVIWALLVRKEKYRMAA